MIADHKLGVQFLLVSINDYAVNKLARDLSLMVKRVPFKYYYLGSNPKDLNFICNILYIIMF